MPRTYEMQENSIDSRTEKQIRDFELAFNVLLDSVSNEYLQKTVGALKRCKSQDDIPLSSMDSEVLNQLKENLNKLVKLGQNIFNNEHDSNI